MSSPAERILSHAQELLNAVQTQRDLHVITERMIDELLQRGSDQELKNKTLLHVEKYYQNSIALGGDPAQLLREGRLFSSEVIALIVRVRRKRGEPDPAPEEIVTYLTEEQLAIPTEEDPDWKAMEPQPEAPLEKAVAPTSVIIVPPPKAENHPEFEQLLAAALRHRIGSITTYFQRWNPRVSRSMPLPFLLSVPFGRKMDGVIEEIITPAMLTSRTVRNIGSRHNWAEIDSAAFWELAEANGYMETLRLAWQRAWDTLRPQASERAAEGGHHMVRKVTPALKDLRTRLTGEEFALPKIGNREIDLLASFLDPEYARTPLENAWTKLRQTYEQELDRRVYQDQARSGALRDSLLACFKPFTNPTAEFLAMLSYWNFPMLSLGFLTAFTHNHGSNRAARERRIPYLIWYLDLPQAETALAEDEARIAQANEKAERQKKQEREREEQERKSKETGSAWKQE